MTDPDGPDSQGATPCMDAPLLALIDDHSRRETVNVRELTSSLLDRIDVWQGAINAFVTIMGETALAEADVVGARRDEGVPGILSGLVVAVKDDLDVAGVPCTVGSARLRNRVPQTDASVVRSLRQADAVIVGKLLLSEFALGSTGDNIHFGAVLNPWDRTRYAGGSSSGSAAAIAADLCIASLGSDAGGSIRIPAALCGVSGLRPTYGSVPADGAHEIAPSIESIGALARSVSDIARAYAAIAQPLGARREAIVAIGEGEGTTVRGLRIGIPSSFFFEDVDADVATAVAAVADKLADLGAHIQDVDVHLAETTIPAGRRIIVTEAYAIHEHHLRTEPESYGPEVRERMLTGSLVSAAQLARDVEACRAWTRELGRAFGEVDAILTPTVGFAARPLAGTRMIAETAELSRLTMPFSVSGGPSLSVPCGFTAQGLPIGAQIASRPGRDDIVLAVGAAYQLVTDWHRRRPPAPGDA